MFIWNSFLDLFLDLVLKDNAWKERIRFLPVLFIGLIFSFRFASWLNKYDRTPDAIYFNGKNFYAIRFDNEVISKAKLIKEALDYSPYIKRDHQLGRTRLHSKKDFVSLPLMPGCDIYTVVNMIDSHKAWLDAELKNSRTS